MTAQHDPHTPPSRRVLALPHTPLGWLAVGLAAGSVLVLLLTYGDILNVLMGVVDSLGVGMFLVGMLLVAVLLAVAVVGQIAFASRRSPQQAPHTPPMWRKYLLLPHTRLGWLAVGLASPVWALWLYFIIDTLLSLLSGDAISGSAENISPVQAVGMVLLFTGPLGIFGAAAGVFALLRSHERSLLVWLALVPVLTFVSLGITPWRVFDNSPVWVFGLWLAVVPVVFLLSLVIYDTASGWLKMRSGKPG